MEKKYIKKEGAGVRKMEFSMIWGQETDVKKKEREEGWAEFNNRLATGTKNNEKKAAGLR